MNVVKPSRVPGKLRLELGPPDKLTRHHLVVADSCRHEDLLAVILFRQEGVDRLNHLSDMFFLCLPPHLVYQSLSKST